MRKILSSALVASLSLAMIGCNSQNNNNLLLPMDAGQSVNSMANDSRNGAVIPGQYIIKFKKGFGSSASFLRTIGAEKLKDIGGSGTGIMLVKMPDNQARSIARNSNIEYIEPNRIITVPRVIRETVRDGNDDADGFPNDPLLEKQWHHEVMESKAGWEQSKGDKGDVVIAILDTGIDGEHPDLKDKIVKGYDAYGNGKELVDKQGHGSHCAGIAAATANNAIGVAGVAVNAKLMSVKVLTDSGSGTYAAVADGIMWAAKNGRVDVISMSLGGPSASQAITDAVNEALGNGKFVTAAMGNSANNSKSYPAAIDGVYAVGATDSKDKRAYFSQYGEWINISAPGVGIWATFPTYSSGMPGKDYGAISGTSMATPAVAGLAALIKGINPSLKGADIEKIIDATADDLGSAGFDEYYGHGRINVNKAVAHTLGRR